MRAILLAFALSLAVPAVGRAAPWVVARSARFEVTSDAGADVARAAVARLERLDATLREILPTLGSQAEPTGPAPPLPVLLLESRSLFESLAPSDRSGGDLAGFFLSGASGPQVVVWLGVAGDTPAADRADVARAPAGAGGRIARWRTLDHELVHLHLNRALPAQPVWLSEGLAEALSGGELEGTEALLALPGPPAARAAAPAEVIAVDWDSSAYRGDEATDAFYAGSLALVRYILARHGLDALLAYARAVADGSDPREAFAGRFGPPEAITADALAAVGAGPLLRMAVGSAAAAGEAAGEAETHRDSGSSARLGETPDAAATAVPSEADVECRLAEALLDGGRTRAAERRFEAILHHDAGHAGAHAGLAQVLLQRGRFDEARGQLRLALAAHPSDPLALLRHAGLLLAEGRSRPEGLTEEVDAEAVAALERAVAEAPGLADAVEMLAHEKPEPLPARIALLRRAFASDPGRPEVGLTLSWLLLKRHDVDEARAVLRRSRDAARDGTYRFLCDRRLADLRGYAGATAEALGRLVRVDCRRDGSLLFTVSTGGGELPLEAASPRDVFVGGSSGPEEYVDFACGAQDVPVRARYRPSEAGGRAGSLLTLDLLEPERAAPPAAPLATASRGPHTSRPPS